MRDWRLEIGDCERVINLQSFISPCAIRLYSASWGRLRGSPSNPLFPSLSPPFGRNLLSQMVRQRLVVGKLHRRGRAPLSGRAQVSGIAEHQRQRDISLDDLGVAARLHTLDVAAA